MRKVRTTEMAEMAAIQEIRRLKLPIGSFAPLLNRPSATNGHGGRRGRGKSSGRGQGKRSGKKKGGK